MMLKITHNRNKVPHAYHTGAITMLATDRFYVRYVWRRERDSFSAPVRTVSNLLIPETEQTAYSAILTQGTHGTHTATYDNPQGPAGHAPSGVGVSPADRPGHCEDEHGAGDIKLPRPGITPRRQPGGGAR